MVPDNLVPTLDYRHGFAGAINRVLVHSQTNGGEFAIVELSIPPGSGPPAHTHEREDELFILLRGEVEFTIGPERFLRRKIETLFAPRGVSHAFKNSSDVPAKALAVYTPGGIEGLFDYGDPAVVGSPPDEDLLRSRFEIYAQAYGLKLSSRQWRL